MKLVDCFMYFDEDLILDIRLNILKEFVDFFVICEATMDHAGNKKKLNFKIENFPKFKDKIRYLIVDDMPENIGKFKKNWEQAHIRDQFQRNSLVKGYRDFDEEDLIMISDIDEIPDPSKIKEFKFENKYACFIQKNFQLKLNLLNITESSWGGTKICKKKDLKSPQWLRNIKTNKRSFWKFYKPKEPQLIFDGGWHFSYLKDAKNISKKIQAFAHQEYNKKTFTDEKLIEKRIGSMVDIFDRNFKYQKINIDDNFPDYILSNKEKFKKWIL